MTKAQAQILDLISRLSPDERREIVDQLEQTYVGQGTCYDRMTPAERAHLDEGLAQSERGEGDEASVVFDRLSRKLHIAKS